MGTLIRRMIGAATLDTRTYEEVEADRSATVQAMVVVALASLGAGIGMPGSGGLSSGLVGGTLVGLVGWAAWAFLTYIIGTRLLPGPDTRADAGELLRTTGFAQAPGVLRLLGLLPGLAPLVWTVVSVWMLIAMVVAVRQALDYTSTFRALAVCLTGWILSVVFAIGIGLLAGPAVSAP